jgi:hypothetical protein
MERGAATAIRRIEERCASDVGRNIASLARTVRGDLLRAAESLARAPAPRAGIITGFFIPKATPPAAETDGPVGAAHLAASLTRIGVGVELITDSPCEDVVEVAVRAAGCGADTPVRVAPLHDELAVERLADDLQARGITHMISIERPGPGADGCPRNMRGQDISEHTAPLHALFSRGDWFRIAIGDGGNEVGMGKVPPDVIAREIALGEEIGCRVDCDALIVAGVSNWGAIGLIAALACLLPDSAVRLLEGLTPDRDRGILEAVVANGPAVDGVLGVQVASVDGLEQALHNALLLDVLAEADRYLATIGSPVRSRGPA